MIARRLKAFGAFWYDFIVGDDWRLALGVVVALAATAAVGHLASVPAWWIVPAVAISVLVVSTWRASRHRS